MYDFIKRNVSLRNFNTFRIGGTAKLIIMAYSENSLIESKVNYPDSIVLGKGSNVLVSDYGLSRPVIINCADEFSDCADLDGTVTFGSGFTLPRAAAYFKKAGYGSLEWACGIPATLGGAAIMNAGAFGFSLSDIVTKIKILTLNGEVRWIANEDCGFSYRHSELGSFGTVLAVKIKAEKRSAQEIDMLTAANSRARLEKQPMGFSAGSVFIGAEKPAGWYIDKAGLKGLSVGDAYVSPKHANFIINKGRAEARDVVTLINTIKAVVFDKFAVKLHEEIRYLGDF